MTRFNGLLAMFAIAILATAGCGNGGHDVGEVTGQVRLGGEPLAKASISFFPVAGGRASIGMTDSNGNYELRYIRGVDGAVIGKHKITVTTQDPGAPPVGDEPGSPRIEEKLSSQFLSRDTTPLEADVKAGSNTFDFDVE